jgi:hypothetical protein
MTATGGFYKVSMTFPALKSISGLRREVKKVDSKNELAMMGIKSFCKVWTTSPIHKSISRLVGYDEL